MMLPISRQNISDDRMIHDFAANLRRLKWVGHVAEMREIKIVYTVWSEKVKGQDNLGNLSLGVHGMGTFK
jgi:hypothetical protein